MDESWWFADVLGRRLPTNLRLPTRYQTAARRTAAGRSPVPPARHQTESLLEKLSSM